MKNPFNEPARESWFCGTWDLSDREFCAHAINQHEKLVAERDEWRNMAAVLCGDGGHYHAEHGTAATRAHIEKKLFDRREQHDKLVAMLQELEWHCEYYGNDYHCPRCGDAEGSHAPYCPLAALLKEEKT